MKKIIVFLKTMEVLMFISSFYFIIDFYVFEPDDFFIIPSVVIRGVISFEFFLFFIMPFMFLISCNENIEINNFLKKTVKLYSTGFYLYVFYLGFCCLTTYLDNTSKVMFLIGSVLILFYISWILNCIYRFIRGFMYIAKSPPIDL